MYYRVPLQTKKYGKYYKILYGAKFYNPYFEYKKVDSNQYFKEFMNQGRWLNFNPLG